MFIGFCIWFGIAVISNIVKLVIQILRVVYIPVPATCLGSVGDWCRWKSFITWIIANNKVILIVYTFNKKMIQIPFLNILLHTCDSKP